ncbi:copine-5 [Platysternon megacephalum]|uniref:Copine-5 n=1 Tax=Platysternon megacephalum TaxID=55544 RepID=A0A4D9DYH0_9SAUR|nr:copine-5 [Platysternon megacephalum]
MTLPVPGSPEGQDSAPPVPTGGRELAPTPHHLSKGKLAFTAPRSPRQPSLALRGAAQPCSSWYTSSLSTSDLEEEAYFRHQSSQPLYSPGHSHSFAVTSSSGPSGSWPQCP